MEHLLVSIEMVTVAAAPLWERWPESPAGRVFLHLSLSLSPFLIFHYVTPSFPHLCLMMTYHLHLLHANEQKPKEADLYDVSRHTQKGGKSALITEICVMLGYVCSKHSSSIHLLGEQTKSHYDVIRHTALPPRNFNNNKLSRKHPPGNGFIGEGDAGTSLTREQVVPSQWNIIIPLNIYLYYCILTEYVQQSQCRKIRLPATNPSGGTFDVITPQRSSAQTNTLS